MTLTPLCLQKLLRSGPGARAFASTVPATSKLQASACHQLPSTKSNKKKTLANRNISSVLQKIGVILSGGCVGWL